jgi:FAD-dependent oxidoreductase domain-containing protein 1
VGAGIIGMSCAAHVKRENPDAKVVVVEKGGACAQGNTARSAALVRNTFTSKTNLALTDSSLDYYLHLRDERREEVGLKLYGYLWLMDAEGYEQNKSAIERLKEHRIEVELFDERELSRIPGLKTKFGADEEAGLLRIKDIDYGLFGAKCGAIEPDLLTQVYERDFLRAGGATLYNTAVRSLLLEGSRGTMGLPGEPYPWQDPRVAGAATDAGRIRAKKTLVAAGAWVRQLTDPVGIDPTTQARKRQLFTFKSAAVHDLIHYPFAGKKQLPVLIFPKNGIYLKPDTTEDAAWIGCSDDLGRAYSFEEDPQPEAGFWEYGVHQVLRKYLPQFDGLAPNNSWAGHYVYQTSDRTPVAFETGGCIVVSGDSGSGIMKADALGRIAAALFAGRSHAELYGGRRFEVSQIGAAHRHVEYERFVI